MPSLRAPYHTTLAGVFTLSDDLLDSPNGIIVDSSVAWLFCRLLTLSEKVLKNFFVRSI
jgi:hypothetical protein